jgi:hypothetical protein
VQQPAGYQGPHRQGPAPQPGAHRPRCPPPSACPSWPQPSSSRCRNRCRRRTRVRASVISTGRVCGGRHTARPAASSVRICVPWRPAGQGARHGGRATGAGRTGSQPPRTSSTWSATSAIGAAPGSGRPAAGRPLQAQQAQSMRNHPAAGQAQQGQPAASFNPPPTWLLRQASAARGRRRWCASRPL